MPTAQMTTTILATTIFIIVMAAGEASQARLMGLCSLLMTACQQWSTHRAVHSLFNSLALKHLSCVACMTVSLGLSNSFLS
jgi:hypothetical protein